MKFIKLSLVCLLTLGFYCCNNNRNSNKKNTQETVAGGIENFDSEIKNSTVLGEVYADTTMFRYFDIDCDGLTDTLTTTVYVKSDTIFINYLWLRQNEIIWHDVITDSYLEALTDSVKKEEWISFVIDGANPDEFHENFDFEDLFLFNHTVNLGLDDLRKKGFNVDIEEYKSYILNYKGIFIDYGHPESREGLFIWYAPLQRLVVFYRP